MAPAQTVVRAMDSGLFDSADGRFGFRHALLREAVVAELPTPARASCTRSSPGSSTGPRPRWHATCDSPGTTMRRPTGLPPPREEAVAIGAVEKAAAYLEEAIGSRQATAALRWTRAEVTPGAAGADAEAAAPGVARAAPTGRPRAPTRTSRRRSGTSARCAGRAARWTHARAADRAARRHGRARPACWGAALAFQAWGESNVGNLEVVDELFERLDALASDDPTVRHEIDNARGFRLLRAGDIEGALASFLAMARDVELGPDRA